MINNLDIDLVEIEEFPVHTDYPSANWEQYSVDMMNKLKQLKPFSQEMIAFISNLEQMISEINNDIGQINLLNPIIQSALNFKGEFSLGTYNKNESVSIGEISYVSKIDNNTDTPPSLNWLTVPVPYTKTEVDAAIDNKTSTLATLTKTFIQDEEVEIPLLKEVLAPNVAVIKEVPELNLTDSTWNVDGIDYEQENDDLNISSNIEFNKTSSLLSDAVSFATTSRNVTSASTNGEYVVIYEGITANTRIRIEDMYGNFIRSIAVSDFTNQSGTGAILITKLNQIVITNSNPNNSSSFKYVIYDIFGTKLKNATLVNSATNISPIELAETTDGRIVIVYYHYNYKQVRYYVLSSSLNVVQADTALISSIPSTSNYISTQKIVSLSNNTIKVVYTDASDNLVLSGISSNNAIETPVTLTVNRHTSDTFAVSQRDDNIAIIYFSAITDTIRGTIVSNNGAVVVSDKDILDATDLGIATLDLYADIIRITPYEAGYKIVLSDNNSTYFDLYSFTVDGSLSLINVETTLTSHYTPAFALTSYDNSYCYLLSTDNTNMIRNYNIPLINTVSEFTPAITSLLGQIDSRFWSDIRSLTITETLNSQEINYAISSDDKNTFQIAKTGEGFRNIAKFDTVWKYNSNTTYNSETWMDATVDNMYQALSEAMSISINKMPKTQIDALVDTEYFTLGNTLDLATILYTDNDEETPVFSGATIDYEGNIKNEVALLGTDYEADAPASNIVRIKALSANNLKVRVS